VVRPPRRTPNGSGQASRKRWSRTHVPIIQHSFKHPPSTVETLATANVETGPKLRKQRSRQTLCEDVCELGYHRYVQDADITDGHAFPHKVEEDLDMLRVLVLNGVGGETVLTLSQ
jgi:hypothetical protein